jgi:hypothetical protein
MAEGKFDAFICHASEDKVAVARPIAGILADAGLDVWYDEFSLKIGDSLRQCIEHGLANSRFGVVILSPSFFAKGWPQAELNGLFAMETSHGKTILPVWHEIEKDEILKRSPIMADKLAARTSDGLERVAEQILDVIEPERLHRCKADRVVSVSPREFRLGAEDWTAIIPVIVSNSSRYPIHALSIKITIVQGEMKSSEMDIEITGVASGVRLPMGGNAFVSGDAIILDCADQNEKQLALVILSILPPHHSREIVVRPRGPQTRHSVARIEVGGFSTEPQELFLVRNGEVALKFRPPENLRLLGIRAKIEP